MNHELEWGLVVGLLCGFVALRVKRQTGSLWYATLAFWAPFLMMGGLLYAWGVLQ
jgi:hypothetical protein